MRSVHCIALIRSLGPYHPFGFLGGVYLSFFFFFSFFFLSLSLELLLFSDFLLFFFLDVSSL